ncbi:hypothetical protein BJX76DRAFT_204794 [Aspergillus varians]
MAGVISLNKYWVIPFVLALINLRLFCVLVELYRRREKDIGFLAPDTCLWPYLPGLEFHSLLIRWLARYLLIPFLMNHAKKPA